MEKEIWKDIPEYEGCYQISDHGRVKSLSREIEWPCVGRYRIIKERIRSLACGSKGYVSVGLNKNGKKLSRKVHVLVLLAFIGERPVINGERYVIDHIDEDKANNRLSNLRYITNRENVSRSKKGGTSEYVGVGWCERDNAWRSRIYIDGKEKGLGYFREEIDAHLAYQDALALIDKK